MTLIEVLLALVIFGIGILSIMSAVSWTIGSLQESRLQTQAIMLAKEGIDLMIYHKNQNSTLGLPRNCIEIGGSNAGQYDCSKHLLESSDQQTLTISYTNNSYKLVENGNEQLYQQTGGGRLFTDQGKQKSPFSRKIIITPILGKEIHKNILVKVTSLVTYTTGGRSRQTTLETYLGKTQ